MSAIDIDLHEPFYLKIKTKGYYITQLVIPTIANIEFHAESVDAISHGRKAMTVQTGISVSTNISFESVQSGKNEIVHIEKE